MIFKKMFFTVVFWGVLGFSGSMFSRENSEPTWEVVSDEDGFVTKKKKLSFSDIFAFRGEMVADVSIDKILTVFLDKSKRKEWVYMFGEQKDIEIINTLNKIYWIRFDTPFIMSDRDYVLSFQGDIDYKNHVVTVKIKSVEHPKKGIDPCCVRAQAFGTYYRFEARGLKTFVEVEVHTDPKGWVPDWVVNIIQKNWPKRTLTNLTELAKNLEDEQVDPKFKNWILESSSKK